MAALTKDQNTLAKHRGRSINMQMAAATQIFAGGIVCADAAGNAVPGSDTAGLTTMGIAEEGVNNTGAAGASEIRVRKGVFELSTTGANAIDQADVGRKVFILDDANVVKALGATNDIPAGILDSVDVESGKFWVSMFDETA